MWNQSEKRDQTGWGTGRITGIGANVFDTLVQLSNFPLEDTKQKAERIVRSGGGPCATGLVAAAKLGVQASWIGVLADDTSGQFLWDDFVKYGVETDWIEVVKERESFASIVLLNRETGTRTCLFHRGNLPPLKLNEQHLTEIARSDLLMIDGNEMEAAVQGARKAKESGTKVLYDAGGIYPNVDRLLPLADILIPSEDFALKYTGTSSVEEAAQSLWTQFHPEIIVITCGPRGGVLFNGSNFDCYPAFSVEVVDSNGAGDVFHGAFAVGVVAGYSWQECCYFASAVSALKCTRLGARSAVPNKNEVDSFIKQNSHNN